MEMNFRRNSLVASALLLAASTWSASSMAGEYDGYTAYLKGKNLVPSVYTPAYGKFKAKVGPYGEYIFYKMYYEGMTGETTAAHLHFGQKFAAGGGAIAFLCGGPYTKPCPTYAGWVKGKISYKDIVGPADQGIHEGDIKSAIYALKKGLTYVNIHTTHFPKGELRGQVVHDDEAWEDKKEYKEEYKYEKKGM